MNVIASLSLHGCRNRDELTSIFLIIDSSLGVTEDDEEFMSLIDTTDRKFHCLMSKADLLSPLQLAQSNFLISEAASNHPSYAGGARFHILLWRY